MESAILWSIEQLNKNKDKDKNIFVRFSRCNSRDRAIVTADTICYMAVGGAAELQTQPTVL